MCFKSKNNTQNSGKSEPALYSGLLRTFCETEHNSATSGHRLKYTKWYEEARRKAGATARNSISLVSSLSQQIKLQNQSRTHIQAQDCHKLALTG